MSVLRTASSVARISLHPQPLACLSRRAASSHAHDEHHDHHADHSDGVEYPKEGFTSAGWRYGALFALGVVGWWKFAPDRAPDVYVTRFLAHYATPAAVWEKINAHHVALTQEAREGKYLLDSAQKPLVHRYRYPQSFDQTSPHLHPVGTSVDLADLVVKSDK